MDRNTYIGLAVAFLTLIFVLYKPSKKTSDAAPVVNDSATLNAGYGTPLVDGIGDDPVWQRATWHTLDQVWIGTAPSASDFVGRYKLCWDESNLYLLAEITDDTLIDIHSDPLSLYWDDDCLEVFLDEDASGGDHQYNYNAFAYHIALDGKVVDIDPSKNFKLYDHCVSKRVTQGKTSIWELAIRVYDGKLYQDDAENIPKMLNTGKIMGFALAYCDNDHSKERENFIGSVKVEGEDKNRGWIDAGVFERLRLTE